jgi:hypothetical protein
VLCGGVNVRICGPALQHSMVLCVCVTGHYPWAFWLRVVVQGCLHEHVAGWLADCLVCCSARQGRSSTQAAVSRWWFLPETVCRFAFHESCSRRRRHACEAASSEEKPG